MDVDGLPPTPQTSVSTFVGVLMLATGLTVVLALLVVRRRHRVRTTVAVVLVTMLVLGAGGILLTVPPRIPRGSRSATLTACPYDRLVWSNMRDDVAESWQPCRRAARAQLTLTLLGASLVTVMAATIAVTKPAAAASRTLSQAGRHDR